MTMTAGQWTGLFFLACALVVAGGWQVVKVMIEDGPPPPRAARDMPRPGTAVSSSLAANEGPTGPGQPDALDELAARASRWYLADLDTALAEAAAVLAQARLAVTA